MRRLVYLTAARADLGEIFRHVAQESGNIAVAHAFIDRLMACCSRLAQLPGTLGTTRPELRADMRSTPCQGYVIFFRYGEMRVEIVNILSGHRDVDRHFRA